MTRSFFVCERTEAGQVILANLTNNSALIEVELQFAIAPAFHAFFGMNINSLNKLSGALEQFSKMTSRNKNDGKG